MADSNATPSKIIPNSYQSPNFLVDELMRYLTGNEHKCVDVVCRKTFGWQKRSDRISKNQLMELTGLGEDAIDQCMGELVKYRVVLRVSESVANLGVEWAMQLDDSLINLQGLIERDQQRRESNRRKMAAAIAKRKGGMVQPPQVVGPPVRGVVEPPPQKPVKANLVVVNAGDVFKIYEQEFGALTPLIADAIQDDIDTYPLDWIGDAMQIAVTNNKRSWSYVQGILKKCKEKQVRPSLNKWEAKENGNGSHGKGNRRSPNQKRTPVEPTQADLELAAEINASV